MSLRAEDTFRRLRGKGWRQAAEPTAAVAIVVTRSADAGEDRTGWLALSCALCLESVLVRLATLAACEGSETPPIWCVQCAVDMVRRNGGAA